MFPRSHLRIHPRSGYPELRQIGRKQIGAFLQEREKYETQVSAARAACANIHPVPLSSSIKGELLLSLFAINTLKGAMKVADVTDGFLLNNLKGFI